MKGHEDEVHSLCPWKGLLFSGDWRGNIRVWNDVGKCVLAIPAGVQPDTTTEEPPPFSAHSNAVTCMKVWRDKLFSGSYDECLKMWRWKEGD